jgi:uncharacterized membrane protein YeaQ/YmgE (transglycosylase-associated protein family)
MAMRFFFMARRSVNDYIPPRHTSAGAAGLTSTAVRQPTASLIWHLCCSSNIPERLAVGRLHLEEMMNIIGWLLFGLIVGAIAKFLMPGRDPGGWIVTILLGIAGSFVGGFLATTLMGRDQQAAGWIGSIIGAMVLLFIYRLIVGRRRVV